MINIKKIAINGKIFSVSDTGLSRVAKEYTLKIDQLLNDQKNFKTQQLEIEMIVPSNSAANLKLNNITVRKEGALKSGYFFTVPWEQFTLPLSLKKNQTLLSLANLSPVFLRNSVVLMTDAQVFSASESYSNWVKLPYKITFFLSGKFAKKIITISEFSKSQLIKYGIARANKITVIHIGCDHILRIQNDERILFKYQLNNKKYVVAQSNKFIYKNISVLFKAFSSKALKDTILVLYGSASKHDFESQNLFVPNNVLFTGRVSDKELKTLIQNALATLTPSLTEGFGLQPLEGMIIGTPAIVAPCGALPEVCGDAALYADPYKAEEWVASVRKLIDEDGYAESLKEKMKLQSQKFTWDNATTKLLDVLKNMLQI